MSINIQNPTLLQIYIQSHSYSCLLTTSYPNLAWDTLFHAGASQIHPHIHMMLAPDHYYGSMEGLRSAAQAYYRSTGKNYFTSLVTIHDTLGLAVEYGDAVVLSSLVGGVCFFGIDTKLGY